MTGQARRLFFALWPTDEMRRCIEHETRDAARRSGGRVIPAANLHITLAFLGSVPESKLADAVECARETVVQPFELGLGDLKRWKRQALLCLEPSSGEDALRELAERLHGSLRARHFAIEHRPFRAHITLAREVRNEHELKPINQLRWLVNRMELLESRSSTAGSVYSVLPT